MGMWCPCLQNEHVKGLKGFLVTSVDGWADPADGLWQTLQTVCGRPCRFMADPGRLVVDPADLWQTQESLWQTLQTVCVRPRSVCGRPSRFMADPGKFVADLTDGLCQTQVGLW